MARPREIDYHQVASLRANGVPVKVIARSLGVRSETVYHALRHGPGPGPANPQELRQALVQLVEAIEGTPVSGLAAPARALLERT